MNDGDNECTLYISDWEQYKPHLSDVKHIVNEFPGNKTLNIKSQTTGLTYVIEDTDVESKELLDQLYEWRSNYLHQVLKVGFTGKKLNKAILIKLKALLLKYKGPAAVQMYIVDENRTFELKRIKVDSENPKLFNDLFELFDYEEDENQPPF